MSLRRKRTLIFKQLYSGSGGNLYTVTASNGNRILLECGVTWPKLQKALDYDLGRFEGCLVSHQHKDHSKALCDVMIAGIDVYANEETMDSQFMLGDRRAKVIRNKDLIDFDSFQVLVFKVQHDVPAVGFVVYEKQTKERLLFATDMPYLKQRFKFPFDIIALECSYDAQILNKLVESGDINEIVAKRLLLSHMEKENAKTYLREFCDLVKGRELHLLHLSGLNIDKESTRQEFADEFFINTLIVGDK